MKNIFSILKGKYGLTPKMVKAFFKIMYIKWILGQCRHRCSKCYYWNECYANYDEEKL